MVETMFGEANDALILGIPYDKTSSFGKGAEKGPAAILAVLEKQIELYDRQTQTAPARDKAIGNMLLPDIEHLSPEEMVREVSAAVSSQIEKGVFTLVLGGEHSIGIGIFDAWGKKRNSKDITIVQLDAHMDLRDDDSDYNENPSKFAHSCVMRRAAEAGFPIVQVGIRAYADFEMEAAKKFGVSVFEWPRSETGMVDAIVSAVKTKDIYITIDVDGIDPAHMPATGTPVQGGLSWQFTFELLSALFSKFNVVGADIVETAPRPGESLTEYGAAQLAYSMIAMKLK